MRYIMEEKQFQEAVAEIWQHVQAARTLEENIGAPLPQPVRRRVDQITRCRLVTLGNKLCGEPIAFVGTAP